MIRLILIVVLSQFVTGHLPTFSPQNRQICEGFGFNWAAEIRCLRDVIGGCVQEAMRNQESSSSRGERSVMTSPEYGNPYSYPRPYSRSYTKYNWPNSSTKENGCKCDELETKFEKKLYEVKMRAQYDNQKTILDLETRFQNEMDEFRRVVTNDINMVKRQLDYLQAPKIINNNDEYFLIKREESWYTASEKCIGYGAQLTSVHNRLENGLVNSLIAVNSSVWIGVNDIQKENVFRNSDGTHVDFFRWAHKQPNNEEHNENCVEMDHSGLWNDKLCIVTRPFVCKKRLR